MENTFFKMTTFHQIVKGYERVCGVLQEICILKKKKGGGVCISLSQYLHTLLHHDPIHCEKIPHQTQG